MSQLKTHFHASVRIGAGGSYQNNVDREAAIQGCLETAVRDWRSMFKLEGKKVQVSISRITVPGANGAKFDEEHLGFEERTFPVLR